MEDLTERADVSDPITDPIVPPTPAPPVAPATPVTLSASVPAPVRREPTEKTFTQAELDERIGKARQAARAAAYRYLGKELGVSVVAESGEVELSSLRTLVDEARTKRAANEETVRDTLARLAETEGRYTEKDSEVRGAIARAQQMLRRGEAKATAIQLGFSDPVDALALIGDLSRFPADLEAGTVTGLEDALKAIATSKPYLLRTADVAPPPISPLTPAPADRRDTALADDDARREGVRTQARSFF
ncbi:MAG: hypothetical protein WCG26_01100 [Chloroflexales bacterium]